MKSNKGDRWGRKKGGEVKIKKLCRDRKKKSWGTGKTSTDSGGGGGGGGNNRGKDRKREWVGVDGREV